MTTILLLSCTQSNDWEPLSRYCFISCFLQLNFYLRFHISRKLLKMNTNRFPLLNQQHKMPTNKRGKSTLLFKKNNIITCKSGTLNSQVGYQILKLVSKRYTHTPHFDLVMVSFVTSVGVFTNTPTPFSKK